MLHRGLLTGFFTLFLALSACSQKKQECNDAFALNYNDSAKSNTACRYPEQTLAPVFIGNLPNKVRETSGLAYVNGLLLTHNDKGGASELYAIEPNTGSLVATYTVAGHPNVDWEDLAQSATHVYVADMGNNDGNRQDLRILKIAKAAFTPGGAEVQVEAVIDFHYPEQTSFFASSKHNWDAEALLYAQGQLYVFTKHRLDGQTALYRIPDNAATHAAERLGSFNPGLRITAADISANGDTVLLLGYNKDKTCEVWELSGFSGQQFVSAQKKRYVLGNYSVLGQMEGLVYSASGRVYISAESTGNAPARLYRLDF